MNIFHPLNSPKSIFELIRELAEDYNLSNNDLTQYMPCDPNELEQNGIEVHYTGYYTKWHPQHNYYYAVEHMDFEELSRKNAWHLLKICISR